VWVSSPFASFWSATCLLYSVRLGWVFFFQAEDGIRYPLVTGVQTCALPISASLGSRARSRIRGDRRSGARSWCESALARSILGRSEERRVGKECRSRWSGSQSKRRKPPYVCPLRATACTAANSTFRAGRDYG